MKKSVQLYSIRNLCKHDLKAGLTQASELGYEGVEFAGFSDNSAQTVKGWLSELNLVAQGAHVAPDLVLDNAKETIEYHKILGNSRIIIPWADLKTKADVLELAKKIKAVAPLYKENGMQIYYHNHSHEFEKDGGEYLLDILADNTAPDELMLELDVYWVYRGGESGAAYLKKYANRLDLFHAKDGTLEGGTAVGKGNVDFKEIFAAAKEIGVEWVVVEAEAGDEEQAQFDDIKTSIEYVNSIL